MSREVGRAKERETRGIEEMGLCKTARGAGEGLSLGREVRARPQAWSLCTRGSWVRKEEELKEGCRPEMNKEFFSKGDPFTSRKSNRELQRKERKEGY